MYRLRSKTLTTLSELSENIKANRCPTHKRRHHVPGVGLARARVMFVGQAPGKREDAEKLPFVGPAGVLQSEMLRSLGFDFKDIYFTNLVKCFPGRTRGGDKLPTEAAVKADEGWLLQELEIVNPDLIVAIGAWVMRYFGVKGGIRQNSGRVFDTEWGPVMPLLHPAGLFRNKTDIPIYRTHLNAITSFLRGPIKSPQEGLFIPGIGVPYGLDIETQDDELWCTGLANNGGRDTTRNTDELRVLTLPTVGTPVGHNMKFDMSYLERHGIVFPSHFDSILEAHLLGHKPLNLKSLTSTFLGTDLKTDTLIGKKGTRYEDNPESVLNDCSKDAWASYKLHEIFHPQILERGWEGLYQEELELSRVVMGMEKTGLPISQSRLDIAAENLNGLISDLSAQCRELGVDPSNRNAIAQKFWGGKKKVATTKTGQLSTARDDLRMYATDDQKEWVEAVLQFRRLEKFKSTYIDNYRGLDWISPSWNQTGTVTWRFSCSGPNFQNIPKVKEVPIFQLFVAPDGYVFISFDYSQIELRVLANVSRDPVLMDIYRNNGDLHALRVETVPSLKAMAEKDAFYADKARRIAKIINFGIPYGITGHGIAKKTRVDAGVDITPEEGDLMGQAFYNTHEAIRPWQQEQIAHAEEHGYVTTFKGRPLYVPAIFVEFGAIRHAAEKQTGNFPIQGGAGEIVKDAMRRCPEYLVAQVHDELLYLVPEQKAQEYFHFLEENLPDYRHEIPYPVEGAIGKTWGELKKIPDVMFDEEDEE